MAAELDDELRFHLELRADSYVQAGMPPERAMAEARRRFGEIESVKRVNHHHAMRSAARMQRRVSLESWLQDIRFALRTIGRQKMWTAVAVVTLALGIGVNTAVFSVINDLILDPLRYPGGDRLVLLTRVNVKSRFEVSPTHKQLDAWRSARSFEGIEGVASDDRTLDSGAEPSVVHTAMISPTFARFAGARVIRGRTPSTDETRKGVAAVAVLSERLWHGRFGGDEAIIGKRISLNGVAHTVIGVLEDGVRTSTFGTAPVDVWLPLKDDVAFLSGPVVARLKRGVSMTAAQQEAQSIAAAIATSGTDLNRTSFEILARKPGARDTMQRSVVLLAAATCLLLLIACANVAHLLLARGSLRERELAIRAALGAGRGRIARQLSTESLLLAGAGCALGVAVGHIGLQAIVRRAPENIGELARVQIDGRVLLMTVGISVVCAVAFGLVAAIQGPRATRFAVLRASSVSTADRKRGRIRALLLISESALSVVLLVGAALLVRTMMNYHAIDPGFDPRGVYAVSVSLPEARYPSAANRALYASQLLAAARRIPGVEGATIAGSAPGQSGVMIAEWEADKSAGTGKSAGEGSGSGFTAMNTVAPEYFAIMRMPIVAGHSFDAGASGRNEVIVSASLARQLFGAQDAMGKRFRAGSNGPAALPWNTVVGVVADANLLGLGEEGRLPAIYYPADPAPDQFFTLIVRMANDVSPADAFRRIARTIDPAMPPVTTLALPELLLHSVAMQQFLMTLLSAFAVLAAVLCAVGLYGVITYAVSQSTREIGIRMALGAARRDVAALVLRQGVVLAATGVMAGLVLSAWGTRLLRGSLYGVSATDPASYAVGAAVLLGLAVAACVGPTLRAIRIEPMTAMRSE